MVLIISVSETERQADLSRSGSGHLIGDYCNHFLFSFLIRNQLRNAVGRGGISSLFPRSARISASCPHLWILKFENKIYNSAPPYKSNSTFFLYKKKFANPKLKRETAVTKCIPSLFTLLQIEVMKTVSQTEWTYDSMQYFYSILRWTFNADLYVRWILSFSIHVAAGLKIPKM